MVDPFSPGQDRPAWLLNVSIYTHCVAIEDLRSPCRVVGFVGAQPSRPFSSGAVPVASGAVEPGAAQVPSGPSRARPLPRAAGSVTGSTGLQVSWWGMTPSSGITPVIRWVQVKPNRSRVQFPGPAAACAWVVPTQAMRRPPVNAERAAIFLLLNI